jgi:predicted nucleic acid-binding protein
VIFVDTSFWVAFRNADDAHHREARRLLAACARRRLVTSNLVRGETWTFLNRKRGQRAAVAFLDALERTPRASVLRIAEGVEEEALRWLRRHDEREYSFVDATSFALMRRLALSEALAFDGDFAAAGFVELRP